MMKRGARDDSHLIKVIGLSLLQALQISASSDGGMGQSADHDSEQLDPWHFQPMSNDQQVSPDTFLENMFVLR